MYRNLGFPGADDLGNMFQIFDEFEQQYRASRSVEALAGAGTVADEFRPVAREEQAQDRARVVLAEGGSLVIKWMVAIKYKAGQSKEASRQYWIDRHGPLALELAGLKHYVQSHRVLGEEDFGDAPYDGFGSLWFENEAVAKQVLAAPQMAALKADADQFADAAGTKQFLAREVVIVTFQRKMML